MADTSVFDDSRLKQSSAPGTTPAAQEKIIKCTTISNACGKPAEPTATSKKLDEYRGASKWKVLIPSPGKDRIWDEGFQSFLVKYGMITNITYDVFISGEGDHVVDHDLRGVSRYGEDFDAFTKKGLEFSYVNKKIETKTEYDFTNDYKVVANLIDRSQSFGRAEIDWFGFAMISNDLKEMVVAFCGTMTAKEWIQDLTIVMEQLDGEPQKEGLARFFNQKNLMVHMGFQQLYRQSSGDGSSPKETIHRLAEEYKDTLDKVTLVGHSLGGAMAQLCGVDLTHSKILGDIPITVITWAAPKIGNGCLAKWADRQFPRLRILRISVIEDLVPKVPQNWLWSLSQGGYHHMGTEIRLSIKPFQHQKIFRGDGGLLNFHCLGQYLFNVDPTRDPALMNKSGDILDKNYSKEHNISTHWHSETWPRTIYQK